MGFGSALSIHTFTEKQTNSGGSKIIGCPGAKYTESLCLSFSKGVRKGERDTHAGENGYVC